MPKMRAALVGEHGGPDKLAYAEVERPEPGPGEMLVRVGACGLNALDVFVRRGLPGVAVDLPHVPGGDIVGWVAEIGDRTSADLLDRPVLVDPIWWERRGVFGEHFWGGLAEYVVAPISNAVPLDGVGRERFPTFAALPIAYGTALRMLRRSRLVEGETLLVLGAAGGVGVACVQFGAAQGARVIACSSSADKLDRLKRLGAGEVINTAEEDFGQRVRELTGGLGADVVIDYIGADTWNSSIRATRRETGRLATCGASSGFHATTDLRYLWTREIQVVGSNGWRRQDLLDVLAMVEAGAVEAVIHGVFPLSRVREAFAELEERRVFGKIIVIPDEVLS